jgi:hypothetical protein
MNTIRFVPFGDQSGTVQHVGPKGSVLIDS